jgi:hypothetical protein
VPASAQNKRFIRIISGNWVNTNKKVTRNTVVHEIHTCDLTVVGTGIKFRGVRCEIPLSTAASGGKVTRIHFPGRPKAGGGVDPVARLSSEGGEGAFYRALNDSRATKPSDQEDATNSTLQWMALTVSDITRVNDGGKPPSMVAVDYQIIPDGITLNGCQITVKNRKPVAYKLPYAACVPISFTDPDAQARFQKAAEAARLEYERKIGRTWERFIGSESDTTLKPGQQTVSMEEETAKLNPFRASWQSPNIPPPSNGQQPNDGLTL